MRSNYTRLLALVRFDGEEFVTILYRTEKERYFIGDIGLIEIFKENIIELL